MYEKLYRSKDNRMLAGICGGLGEYFNIDPTIVRLLFIFGALFAGIGVIPYLVGWIVIPLAPRK
jgi:phage shock protein C